MKTKVIEKFECEICGHTYANSATAKKCESRPISHDKGVKIGDKIIIIQGQGQGIATVESRRVIDMEWGHYAADRYWHTVGLTAKCDESYGHRSLTFDDYELITP